MTAEQDRIAFAIDRDSGGILFDGALAIEPRAHSAEVELRVRDLILRSRDHGNGYRWLDLGRLSFGGRPAWLSLAFHDAVLEQIDWSVTLDGAESDGGWPTREAIDAEIAFVRATLVEEMGIVPGTQAWGEVWSLFDPKGFQAANGLRYR
ncbi:hypothetical protein DMC47_10985 [Nostoc sp. 3335mG]|nr:hypothetical protein DMC47_10985 [Nostoc sp. 3335mG]